MKKHILIAVISILLFASGLLITLLGEKSNGLAIVSISLSILGISGLFTSMIVWAFTKEDYGKIDNNSLEETESGVNE
jgi:hypothetical protein